MKNNVKYYFNDKNSLVKGYNKSEQKEEKGAEISKIDNNLYSSEDTNVINKNNCSSQNFLFLLDRFVIYLFIFSIAYFSYDLFLLDEILSGFILLLFGFLVICLMFKFHSKKQQR